MAESPVNEHRLNVKSNAVCLAARSGCALPIFRLRTNHGENFTPSATAGVRRNHRAVRIWVGATGDRSCKINGAFRNKGVLALQFP